MILITKTSDQARQRAHTIPTCTVLAFTLLIDTLCFLAALQNYLGGQLLNEPFCVCICVWVCTFLIAHNHARMCVLCIK